MVSINLILRVCSAITLGALAAPLHAEALTAPGAPSSYVLGSGDQIVLQVTPDGEEINGKAVRIDEKGDVNVPMIGSVHAAGFSSRDFAVILTGRLKTFFRDPQVTVSVAEMRSQPVSILGAVNSPGVHQLEGHKTLIEALALAGGLRNDSGYRVKITRRAEWGSIPLPGVTAGPEGTYFVAEVPLKSLMEAQDPGQNIPIMPNDVLTVPAAEMVYVIGEVKRAGGFVLGSRERISVLQALGMSEGLGPNARSGDSRILRVKPGVDERTEIRIDIKSILAGRAPDVTLQSSDILFIPVNGAKRLGNRALDALLPAVTGLAIYRP